MLVFHTYSPNYKNQYNGEGSGRFVRSAIFHKDSRNYENPEHCAAEARIQTNDIISHILYTVWEAAELRELGYIRDAIISYRFTLN